MTRCPGPGDLVRYSLYPHYELHMSGMIGLVVSGSYVPKEPEWVESIPVVDVIWNTDRGLSYPAGAVSWDYVDELEIIL